MVNPGVPAQSAAEVWLRAGVDDQSVDCTPMITARVVQVVARPGRWHFGIGDRTAIAWIIVAAYACAAVLAAHAVVTARAAQRRLALTDAAESQNQNSMKHVWVLVTLTMIGLGINKQLDLQTLLIQALRRSAYRNGWYNDRRRYQEDFIVLVAILAVAVTAAMAIVWRRVVRRVWLALAGLGVLVAFVIVRAASLHYIDKVLGLGGSIRVNWMLELSGIGLIIAAAIWWQSTECRRSPPST
jgi:hypothetical protein